MASLADPSPPIAVVGRWVKGRMSQVRCFGRDHGSRLNIRQIRVCRAVQTSDAYIHPASKLCSHGVPSHSISDRVGRGFGLAGRGRGRGYGPRQSRSRCWAPCIAQEAAAKRRVNTGRAVERAGAERHVPHESVGATRHTGGWVARRGSRLGGSEPGLVSAHMGKECGTRVEGQGIRSDTLPANAGGRHARFGRCRQATGASMRTREIEMDTQVGDRPSARAGRVGRASDRDGASAEAVRWEIRSVTNKRAERRRTALETQRGRGARKSALHEIVVVLVSGWTHVADGGTMFRCGAGRTTLLRIK
ncbi:hypothetical protein B0H10DRAFT_1951089 [Mycena sp. CBHHK59/15]|nr:hypothetical protein B0H10DRAFT_1951089 [Mycena sp. CBHHK59/15]